MRSERYSKAKCFFALFISRILADQEEFLDGCKRIAKVAKFRILSFASVILSLSSTVFFVVNLKMGHGQGADQASLALIAGSFLALVIYLNESYDVEKAAVAFVSLALIFIPIRMYFTGGISSPGGLAYVGLAVSCFGLFGRLWGSLALGIGICFFLGFASVEPRYHLIRDTLAAPPLLYGWVAAMMLGLVCAPILFLIQQKDELTRDIRRWEKQRAGAVIMRRVNHEIGNSLAVAQGLLEVYKLEKDRKLLKKIKRALREIEQVADLIESGAKAGELVAFLDQHKETVKILQAAGGKNHFK